MSPCCRDGVTSDTSLLRPGPGLLPRCRCAPGSPLNRAAAPRAGSRAGGGDPATPSPEPVPPLEPPSPCAGGTDRRQKLPVPLGVPRGDAVGSAEAEQAPLLARGVGLGELGRCRQPEQPVAPRGAGGAGSSGERWQRGRAACGRAGHALPAGTTFPPTGSRAGVCAAPCPRQRRAAPPRQQLPPGAGRTAEEPARLVLRTQKTDADAPQPQRTFCLS